MNPWRITKISLLLNVVLAGALAYEFRRFTLVTDTQKATSVGEFSLPSSQSRSASNPKSDRVTAENSPLTRADWRQIESTNYSTYIANLRAIGCPEQTIRDIIVADVNKLYGDRKAAAYQAAKGPFTFWTTANSKQPDDTQTAQLTETLAQLDSERSTFLAQLVGPGADGDPAIQSEQQMENQRRLAFLPPAKQKEVRALDLKYPGIDEQIHAIVDVRSSVTDPHELQQILDRYASKQADLNQVLSRDEYDQYDLSTSWTADNLRRRLAAFTPSEEEFRAIFRAWRAHDEALAVQYALHQPEPGNVHVFEAVRQALGEDRYAQYLESWGSQPVPPAGQDSTTAPDSPEP